VTRTVVAVVDVTAAGVLAELVGASARVADDLIMPLRRVSATGLRSWLTDNEQMPGFGDGTLHTRLMAATGGWPVLLDRAVDLAAEGVRAKKICDELAALPASAGEAEQFLTDVGLRADPLAAAAFGILVDYADPLDTDGLLGWCADAGPDPARIAAVLQILDVIVQDDTDGLWLPEPVTAAAWKTVHRQL
jgi:hypothetical protein